MRLKNWVSLLQISHLLALSPLLVWATSARAQTVVATIPSGAPNQAVAVNSVTNKIYVTGAELCSIFSLNPPGIVTVIDGATNSTTTITAGVCLRAVPMNPVAVNPVTNKIYVASGEIIVIDGATNSTTTVADPDGAEAIAVNPVTNKIYVGNAGTAGSSASVTVIDGATNSTTTVTDPNTSGLSAVALTVNPATNKIYVANNSVKFSGTNPGNVTVIDGATNATTTISDPNAISPDSVAVNSVTNKVYVVNGGDYPGLNHGNITVIDGATNAITTLTDPNALGPRAVAVNQTTNKIYITNANDSELTGNGGVTVIDGATNAITTVRDPNAIYPTAVAVDPLKNAIYVVNGGCFFLSGCTNPGSVSVINGATNATLTVIDPDANAPDAIAVNPTTNRIYVANYLSQNMTVIDGGTAPMNHTLSLLVSGNGSGTVTSNPSGINCTSSCTGNFASGTTVNLTASPAPGSTFSGWSNACTGTGSCNLTLNSDDFVTATFVSSGDFSVEPASLNLTLQRGGQVTDVITIAPLNGSFSTVVQLSCAVTPSPVNPSTALATCSLSPTSITPGSNSVTSTLTVAAPTQSAELIPSGEAQLSRPLYAVFLPISFALVGLGLAAGKSRNGKRSLWLLCSLSLVFVALQAGCGGGSSSGQQIQPQKYTVTVTATSGAIQHTTQVTVTVQ